MMLLMLATEVVLTPMVAFLFHAPFFARPLLLVALLGLGTIGFASVGTLFAAMLVRTRTRDVLLPILLYPVTIPVIIAGRSRHVGARCSRRRTKPSRRCGSAC